MSKASGRKKSPTKRHKQRAQQDVPSAFKADQKKILGFAAVAILAGVPFFLGKYFEFNSPGPYDSASNVYSAKHVLEGARIGIEERTSAAMGTLIVNIAGVGLFGFKEFGPKLIQGIFQAAALLLMFITMRRLCGTLPAAVAVILTSVYLSAPLLAKFGNVKEQYMIALMVIGASCFVFYYLGGKMWQAILAGAIFAWVPLFKETGYSVIGAVGVFVIAQLFLKRRNFKQTARTIGLLLGGAVISLTPMYIWLLAGGHKPSLKPPYSLIYKPLASAGAGSEQKMSDAELPRQAETDDVEASEGKNASSGWISTYISRSWQSLSPQQRRDVVKRVLRYYVLLILPVAMALASIVAESTRVLMRLVGRLRTEDKKAWEPFVLLFAVWWLLDMAFVWVSPRSYEQYYLPLNASAAMLGGCCIALWRDRLLTRGGTTTTSNPAILDIFFFGIWIVAAAFVVSKVFRTLVPGAEAYSQYRLVLIAAVIFFGLGPVALLRDRLSRTVGAFRWGLAGAIASVCMLVMCWHVLFGIGTSPHSGVVYLNTAGEPEKRRGYAQKMQEVSGRRKQNWKAPWETVGRYIGARCGPEDKIYVWGWVPGIYVEAQKLCPAPKAFEGNMHIHPPQVLARIVGELLASFKRDPPKLIVDTHKSHFPWDRPPLELWPMTREGPLPNDEETIREYDGSYMQWLRDNVDEEEVQRYEAMRPFREYVMNNYRVVVRREFGQHVLFERK